MIRLTTGRIVAAYATLATLWILVSAALAHRYWPGVEHTLLASVLEGAAFVSVTTALLYAIMRRQHLAERRAAEVMEASPVVLFRWRPEPGRPVVYVSSNVGRWGYRPEQFMGEGLLFASIVHPDDLEGADREVAEHTAAGQTEFVQRYRILTATGETIRIEDLTTIVRNADGSVLHYQGTITDVSAARRAEAALRDSEERLRVAVAAASIGLFDWNLATNRVRYSPEWKRQLGHEPAEINDDFEEWRSRVHPDDLQTALDTAQAYIRAPWPNYSLEFRMLHKDGDYRWIRAQGALVADETGSSVRMVGGHIDITERVAIQHQLEDERSRFRALAEQSLVGIYAVDGDTFTYVNPRAAEIFGYGADELTGTRVLDRVAAPDRALVQKHTQRRMSGEVKAVRYEFRGLCKDGSEIMVGVHGSRVDVDGKRLIIGVISDITEKLRHQQEIDEHIRRLEQTVLGTVGAISHMVELRDPYTAGHERRVGEMAAAIAAEMGLDEHTQQGLRIAGSVHDVGKITVPAEILAKPSPLTLTERELVRTHAATGFEVLRNVIFPWPVAEVAHQHHERMDGSGYPRGLKGEEILLEARIIAVADVVESMTNYRPYRPAEGLVKALEEIGQHAGTLYDTHAAAACLRLFREKGYSLPD